MLDTIGRYMQAISNVIDAYPLLRILNAFGDRYSSAALTSAGLVINAGGATFPKTGATDCYVVAGGTIVKVAAGTALPALTGITITAGAYNVACYYVDAAGALTVLPGTQGATLGAVLFAQPPAKKALLGFLIITYASPFVGGTTPLDTATTVYVSPVGAFDPTVLL